jgi:hypothetical protein
MDGVEGPPRLPRVAHTHEDALRYYQNRARQLLVTDFVPEPPVWRHPWGIEVRVRRGDARYHSLFVLESHRGQGHLSRWRQAHPDAAFVVMDPCDAVTAWLAARGVPHVVAPLPGFPEYRAAEAFLGDRVAARTGVPYQAHVDEGRAVLSALGASDLAHAAFCLHPLVQTDADLRDTIVRGRLAGCRPDAVALAMEYRRVANLHLSRHTVADPAEIELSPLPEVQDLLRADKVQNRMDFERHHAATHPQRERLSRYFAEWFARLSIAEADYAGWVADIRARTELPVVDGAPSGG